MAELKQKVEAHAYHVDSALVAEAIIRKMRTIRSARVELSGVADRSPTASVTPR